MVVLSFFLCYNVQQAQQKNKRREAAFVFLCLLQRANLLRSRRRSAEARVCEYAPEGAEEKSKATAKQKKERGSAGLRVCTRKGAEEKSKPSAKQKKERESAGDGRGDFTWRKKKDSVFIKREKR